MLEPSLPTFVWVFINLIILYLILRKILFKPVTKFMEDRAGSIKRDLENAEKAREEADQIKLQYEEKLKSAREDADRILNIARERAEKERDEILREARNEAEAILKKAREQIEREHEQMVQTVRNQVVSLALAAATKVVEANMDTDTNRALVDKFINEEGAA